MASDGEPALDIPPAAPDGSIERHNVYYLETIVFRVRNFLLARIRDKKSIIMQVENTLFRVPRREFELESPVFASMFSLPTGNHSPEGQDDNSPIVLQGIKSKDFQSLLELMYPM